MRSSVRAECPRVCEWGIGQEKRDCSVGEKSKEGSCDKVEIGRSRREQKMRRMNRGKR